MAAGACRPATPSPDARWTLDPARSSVGEPTSIRLALTDAIGQPITGARLQVEAQMTHPGMPAIVVPLSEPSPGVYEGTVRFSMRGDWVLTATGEAAGGGRIAAALAVPDVTRGR